VLAHDGPEPVHEATAIVEALHKLLAHGWPRCCPPAVPWCASSRGRFVV
jgi:hypothetical protein